MSYVGALGRAVVSAVYWVASGLIYYASVAGDHHAEARDPTFLETYGRGLMVLAVATLLFSAIIYLDWRRRPR